MFNGAIIIIDAHIGGGGEGELGRGHLKYSLKRHRKLDHKNPIKNKNRGPPPRFSHYPKYPPTPSNEFENDCTSMILMFASTTDAIG
jgi:hypothetical protein